jgi:hypothetical protein
MAASRTGKALRVFVASVNEEGRTDVSTRYLELRAKIEGLGLRPQLDPWIAEYAEPRLLERGWRAVIDTCVNALHSSDLMIVLLYRRLGTSVDVDSYGPSPVTYLEIELFHACLRRIPVLFFQAEDFDPDPRLAAMVRLLNRITPSGYWISAPERELEQRVLDTLRHLAGEQQLPEHLLGFCDALSDQRSFERVETEINSERLSFLRDFSPGDPGEVSIDRVDLLLSEADQYVGSGEGAFVGRLSRLWLALRELAQRPTEYLDDEIAARWIRLCESWTNSAAWLHLHGPLELGVLATLHTRVGLRQAGFVSDRAFPFGAFASEAYSIAKVSDTRDWQCRRFDAARRLATRQIAIAGKDTSGAFGIRASAAMQLAQRGKPWLIGQGLRDYQRMLVIRKRLGSSPSEVGEAEVELGYALFAIGRHVRWTRNDALARLRDGVRLMESDGPEKRAGFVKRGKLKLLDALEKAGLADEAAEQRRELEIFTRDRGLPLD